MFADDNTLMYSFWRILATKVSISIITHLYFIYLYVYIDVSISFKTLSNIIIGSPIPRRVHCGKLPQSIGLRKNTGHLNTLQSGNSEMLCLLMLPSVFLHLNATVSFLVSSSLRQWPMFPKFQIGAFNWLRYYQPDERRKYEFDCSKVV